MKKRRRLAAVFIAVIMVFTMMPSIAFAEDEGNIGETGPELAIYVTNNNAKPEYYSDKRAFNKYKDGEYMVTTPNGSHDRLSILDEWGGYDPSGTSGTTVFNVFLGYEAGGNVLKFVDDVEWTSGNDEAVKIESFNDTKHIYSNSSYGKVSLTMNGFGEKTEITAKTADGRTVTSGIKLVPCYPFQSPGALGNTSLTPRNMNDVQIGLTDSMTPGQQYKMNIDYASIPKSNSTFTWTEADIEKSFEWVRDDIIITSINKEIFDPETDEYSLTPYVRDSSTGTYTIFGVEMIFTPKAEGKFQVSIGSRDSDVKAKDGKNPPRTVSLGDLSSTSYTFVPGEEKIVSVTSPTAVGPFTWTPDDEDIATVSVADGDGKDATITAVANGRTKITVTNGNGFTAAFNALVRGDGWYLNGEYTELDELEGKIIEWDTEEKGTAFAISAYQNKIPNLVWQYSTNTQVLSGGKLLANTAEGETVTYHFTTGNDNTIEHAVSLKVTGMLTTSDIRSATVPLTGRQEGSGVGKDGTNGFGIQMVGGSIGTVEELKANAAYFDNYIYTDQKKNNTEFTVQVSLMNKNGGDHLEDIRYPSTFLSHLTISEETSQAMNSDWTKGRKVASYNDGYTLESADLDNSEDPAKVNMKIKVDEGVLDYGKDYVITVDDEVPAFDVPGMYAWKRDVGTVWHFSTAEAVPFTSVKFDKKSEEVIAGGSVELVPVTAPTENDDSLLWTSSDEDVAVVDELTGKVTGKSAGFTVITAASKLNPDIKALYILEVRDAPQDKYHSISSRSNGNGAISTGGDYKEGTSATFVYMPNAGNRVSALYVDGNAVAANSVGGSYTFTDIRGAHQIEVFFEADQAVLGQAAAPKKAAPRSFKARVQKRTAKLTWRRSSGVTRYQVAFKKRSAKKWKYKTVSAKSRAVTVKKLKSNNRYQFRIRSYKTTKGKKVYSKWSKIKIIRIK